MLGRLTVRLTPFIGSPELVVAQAVRVLAGARLDFPVTVASPQTLAGAVVPSDQVFKGLAAVQSHAGRVGGARSGADVWQAG
jgi:hypothetical protein